MFQCNCRGPSGFYQCNIWSRLISNHSEPPCIVIKIWHAHHFTYCCVKLFSFNLFYSSHPMTSFLQYVPSIFLLSLVIVQELASAIAEILHQVYVTVDCCLSFRFRLSSLNCNGACLPAKVCHANKYTQYQENVSTLPSANKTDREANETQQSNRKLLGMNWNYPRRWGLTWEVGTLNSL